MASVFHLAIITPDGEVLDQDVASLAAPGEAGAFGVLAGHAPMVAGLQPGVLSVTTQDTRLYFAVGAGLAEVSEGHVIILADSARQADSKEEAKRLLEETSR
jgi:F-type H+-transporting ATPase subunit epsilon